MGTHPYDVSGSVDSVRKNIQFAPPKSFSQVRVDSIQDRLVSALDASHDLERVVLKALAKERERRYQSATEFADDLTRFLHGEAVAAKADSHFYILRKALRRYRIHVTIVAAF